MSALMETALDHNVASGARRLGVSEEFLRRRIKAGEIAHYRIGRHIRLAESDLADYLKRVRQPVKAA